jgi:phosphatidylglycerophosphatase A
MRDNFLSCFGLKTYKNGDIICLIIALIFAVLITSSLNGSSLFSLAFAIGVVSVFEIDKFLAEEKNKDSILIAKVIGIWITFSAVSFGAIKHHLIYPLFISGVLALFTFLLFTIWRPSTIGWIDKNIKGGLGVVLAEVLAGFAGGILGLMILSILTFKESLLVKIFLS